MRITDYPQLTNVLKDSASITYLCGAGLSMSLGEHNKSWWHWLQAGKSYLNTDDQKKFDLRIGSGSAEEMITAAGFLLEKLKNASTYGEFMRQEMLSIHPENKEDISALRLMNRAGDFLATTNYDTSIEQAIGIGTATYSEPDKVLAILKRQTDRKVIHLHGAYIPSRGIDDIIADDAQYEAILKNQGAQFLQALIGTNPIIIVGCGGTKEDPNMSGFLSFSAQYLRTNIPYFYLYRKGDDLKDLPDNFIPICYGEEYSDLSSFLMEIGSYRIRFHSGFDQMMEINPYETTAKSASAFGRMHFLNRFNKFIGRKKEMASLKSFCEKPDQVLFWSVIGEGGIGKSRFLLEYLTGIDSAWFGFFGRKSVDVYEKLVPFSNTVVVFDYIVGEEEKCAEAIRTLIHKFESSAFKLRIVFLERKFEKGSLNWFHEIEKAFGASTRIMFDRSQYSKDPLILNALMAEEEKEYISSYIETYALYAQNGKIGDDHDSVTDISSLTAKADEIEQAFREQLPPECYRPLYLSIFIEVWIYKSGVVSVTGANELLEEFLQKEEKRWSKLLNSEEALYAYKKILALACAIEVFSINEPDNGYLQVECNCLNKKVKSIAGFGKLKRSLSDLFIYEQREDVSSNNGKEIIDKINKSSSFSYSEKVAYIGSYMKVLSSPEELQEKQDASYQPKVFLLIRPVYPDIIREFIADYYTDETEWTNFARLARSISVLEFGRFLTKAMDDFPEEESFQKMALTKPEAPTDMFEMYFTFLTSPVLLTKHPNEIAKVLQESSVTDELALFEMETWNRLILANYYQNQYDQAVACGFSFIDYVKKRYKISEVEGGFSDVINNFCGIVFEKRNKDLYSKLTDYTDQFYEAVNSIGNKDKDILAEIATVCSENHFHLAMLKEQKDGSYGVKKDWDKAVMYYELYPEDADIAHAVAELSEIYMRFLTKKKLFKRAGKLTKQMEKVSKSVPDDETVGKYAICLSNIYGMNSIGMKECSPDASNESIYEALGILEELFKKYPDNQDVAKSYGVAKSDSYFDKSSDELNLTDEQIRWYREQFEQHKDDVELAESYARILGLQAEKVFQSGDEKRAYDILNEMRRIGREADLHEYEDEDANSFIETADEVEEIFGLRKALEGKI